MAIIAKTDFNTYVQFTQNIEDRIIDFHIRDAELFDFKPNVPLAFWTAITGSPGAELTSFRDDFVKPLLVYLAYKRFLLWQGRNVTQYSIVTPSDTTSQPISDTARGELINDIQSKIAISQSAYNKELSDQNWTFDGTVYSFEDQSTQRRQRFSKI